MGGFVLCFLGRDGGGHGHRFFSILNFYVTVRQRAAQASLSIVAPRALSGPTGWTRARDGRRSFSRTKTATTKSRATTQRARTRKNHHIVIHQYCPISPQTSYFRLLLL
jgi:hypothetical protein